MGCSSAVSTLRLPDGLLVEVEAGDAARVVAGDDLAVAVGVV